MSELQAAWKKREQWGAFQQSEAVRVFHGPGEGEGDFRKIAIDRFGEHYWITEWSPSSHLDEVKDFLLAKAAKSAVHLVRPEKGIPGDPEVLFGTPPEERFAIAEGKLKFWIQLTGVKHPGLFLDHSPLRDWLVSSSRGKRVLNTFAYTGSLSVAAGKGGASEVTTLDLSKPTLEWAKSNWELNALPAKAGDFIFGDYFEWLPKLAKKSRKFDLVVLDPPSFSRGKKGSFSTAKDLERLHELALDVLEKGGILATSINSESVSQKKFYFEIHSAAKTKGRRLEVIRELAPPRTFPIRPSAGAGPDLKGWILRCS